MNKWITLIAICLIASVASAQYQQQISSDRPGQAFTPYTVGKGILQLQTGLSWGGLRFSANDNNTFNHSTDLRFGLWERFELSGNFTWGTIDFQSDDVDQFVGVSNWNVGARVNLLEEEKHKVGLGIVGQVNYSNLVSKVFETDKVVPFLSVLATKGINDWFSVSGNLGVIWTGAEDNDANGSYVLNLSFSTKGKTGFFIENFGLFGKVFDTFFDGGISYLLTDHLQLDALGGYGRNDGTNSFFVGMGVSLRSRPN